MDSISVTWTAIHTTWHQYMLEWVKRQYHMHSYSNNRKESSQHSSQTLVHTQSSHSFFTSHICTVTTTTTIIHTQQHPNTGWHAASISTRPLSIQNSNERSSTSMLAWTSWTGMQDRGIVQYHPHLMHCQHSIDWIQHMILPHVHQLTTSTSWLNTFKTYQPLETIHPSTIVNMILYVKQ